LLAKKTVKNQLTLPKKIADKFPATEYFDVRIENGAIILRPVRPEGVEEVREKLARLGITEKDVRDAIAWGRRSRR
jgi:bifunctional DNA-binding transcriptional regulator/antitoxin component of YhaV-PrlF toxin-antitoxin module